MEELIPIDNPPLQLPPDDARAPSCSALSGYLRAARSASTRRAYASDVRHYLACGGSLPASPLEVANYLAEHAARLRPSTLARRAVAIRAAHQSLGHADPCESALVREALKGIRRVHGVARRRVAPLLRDQLERALAALPASIKGLRDRALLLVGFAGAMRRSELVALVAEDVSQGPEGVALLVRRSKTDQEGRGRLIAVPAAPAAALLEWLRVSEIEAGPVFRPVARSGAIRPVGLSAQSVALVVKAAVRRIGLDPASYAGHSLRAGFMSSAAELGMTTWQIRQQSGHRSDAIAQTYMRSSVFTGANVAKAVFNA